MISCMISVMDVKLGVYGNSSLRKNRASIMNELSMQNIRIRSTTALIDSRISCFASRSHGKGIVVKEDPIMKLITDLVMGSKKII